MPFKRKQQKKLYNKEYRENKLGARGSYNTLSNVTYPLDLDYSEDTNTTNSFSIGRRRVKEFRNILSKLYPESEGYEIWINRVEGRGVDVEIKMFDKLHTVMELTNYRSTSFFSRKTVNRYLKTLKGYKNVRRIMVISYPQNIPEKYRKEFEKNIVEILVMGYQA